MNCFSIYGQQNGKVYIDSLKGKSYEYFLEKLQVDEQDENSIVLSNAYLQKAKSEKNWKQMMNAYKIILHQAPKRQRIFYADSMIVASRRTKENDLIGSAYLTKGIVYYDLQDFNNALDNYLIADEFIATTTDE